MTDKLVPQMNMMQLVFYYLVAIIGAGILIMPGIAGQIAGPASIFSWILLAIMTYPMAIVFAEISIHTVGGGIPILIQQSINSTLARAIGILLLITMIVGNPILGIASAYYLHSALGFDSSYVLLSAYGFMLIAVLCNMLAIGTLNKFKVLVSASLIFFLIFIIVLSSRYINLQHFTPLAPHGWQAVGHAMGICFFSFIGWESATFVGREIKNPRQNFRKAINYAVFIIALLYTLIAFIYFAVVPSDERVDHFTVLSQILQIVTPVYALYFGNAIAILLLVFTTHIWVYSASRLLHSLSQDRLMPIFLSKLNQHSKQPTAALMFFAVAYALAIYAYYILKISPPTLICFANANFMVIYFLAFIAGIKTLPSRKMKLLCFISLILLILFIPFIYQTILISISVLLILYLLLKKLIKH